MRGQVERFFLLWARPLAPLLCMGAYGVLELVRPETPSERILVPLALSVATAVLYVGLLRSVAMRRVLQLLVVLDTFLIASMTVALRQPEVLAIAYFWSIALAAFFLGARETLVATAVAAACAAVVPYLAESTPNLVVVVTDVIVLVLIGGLLAVLAAERRGAEEARLAHAELDAVVLRIAARVRASLDLDAVLTATVEELARATGSARGLFRLVEGDRIVQWTRSGVPPASFDGVPPTVTRAASTRQPLVVESREDDVPDELRAYMERFGTHAIVAVPVVHLDEVVAVIGVHDDKPRRWTHEVALIERVAPQVGAAIAQARAFREQQEVARMRESLVANVSHELRTPLTSTLGFLRTLEREDLDLPEPAKRQLLTVAREQAERLALLVEDLLELASTQFGALDVRDGVAVENVVRRAATGLPLDGRELRIEVEPGLTVDGDPDRLVQVLTNLLANAVEHGNGTITVDAARRNGAVQVAVSDEGPGLPRGHVEDLFAPFARWNTAGTGTGLGLAISRAIASAHGGTLDYEDGAFRLCLPA